MKEISKCPCCCNLNKCMKKNEPNKSSSYKRTLRTNQKFDHWKTRNNSVQMCALLTPDDYEETLSECSCDEANHPTNQVTKTKAKIKWASPHNKHTTSRYHNRCFTKKPKPKTRTTSPKRNVITSQSCNLETEQKCKFKNECYCSHPPDKPFLPGKLIDESVSCRKTVTSRSRSPQLESESSHSLETLQKAKTLLDYSPESEFLKRLRKEAKEVYDCQCAKCKIKDEPLKFKYTNRRAMLEEAYENYNEQKRFDINELCRDKHKCQICSCNYCKSPHESINSTKNNRHFPTQNKPTSIPIDDCEKIHAIRHIRNEHYFDTHSANHLTPEVIPEHKCVHKFTLDDRLLPKPLNADVYGVSRCCICNKPMENKKPGTTSTFPSSYTKNSPRITSGNAKSESLDKNLASILGSTFRSNKLDGNLKRSKSIQTSPRIINIGSSNDIIELKIPPSVLPEQKQVKFKRPMAPHNSWALRYQKGVV